MSEKSKPKIKAPAEVAGGITAVANALRHAWGKAGLVRGTRALRKLNQKDGLDCPGCAWPEPNKRSHAEFCENGAKALADEATTKTIGAEFFAKYSIAELKTKTPRWLNAQGRLAEPLVLREGEEHYQQISWDEALDLVSAQLRILASPDQAVFYTSGRTSNEAAFLYQLLARQLGTNNLPDCSNLCHESSGYALSEVIGVGKGTVNLEDFDQADAIFVVGQNPGSNHPRMLATLQQASKRGADIVSINPLDETGLHRFKNPQKVSGYFGPGTLLANLYVPVRINGDGAVFKAMAKAIFENEQQSPHAIDHDFIHKNTVGFAQYKHDIQSCSWGSLTRVSGVDIDVIKAAAEILGRSNRVIFCWAMGLTQHRNAVANIQQIVNLLLLGGHFGKPGAGACPVRGHSNVQGDRTMGIWEKPAFSFLNALHKEFGFAPPEKHGFDTVASIQAMMAGRVKFFMGMGGNFAGATPDTERTARALSNCRLTVQVSTKLNVSHLHTGRAALILPALTRSEIDVKSNQPQYVTTENSMGVVRRSMGVLTPVSDQVKSEVDIICSIGQRMFVIKDGVDWPGLKLHYDRIRSHISKTIPGFENYNERIERDSEFTLPHPVRDKLEFPTASGRAHFSVHSLDELTLEDNEFLLTTIRSHDQFNTTVYSENDRYRGIRDSRKIILINEQDMAERGMAAAAEVDVCSHYDGETRTITGFALVPYAIPRGCLAAYYPEANPLVPLANVAIKSNTPAYKSIIVTLRAN